MKAINNQVMQTNEYTTPIVGQPDYENSGIIFANDQSGTRYAVAQIDYQRFDEQNFQYIFSPQWSVIDALPSSIFQGIPGLNMDLRLKHYYRVNKTPYFVTERTPSESREDLWPLLQHVGMDYYDRFEWMLRTKGHGGTDELHVERKGKCRTIPIDQNADIPNDLQPTDRLIIRDFYSFAYNNHEFQQSMIRILGSGAKIENLSEGRELSDEEKSTLLSYALASQYHIRKSAQERREDGIARAKIAGRYAGRKRLPLDENLFHTIAADFRAKRITIDEAMRRSGISSKSTFYRRLHDC